MANNFFIHKQTHMFRSTLVVTVFWLALLSCMAVAQSPPTPQKTTPTLRVTACSSPGCNSSSCEVIQYDTQVCVNAVKGLPGGSASVWIECGPDFVGIASFPQPNCAAAPEITTPIYNMRTNECHAYGLTYYTYASYQCVGNASEVTQLFYSTSRCEIPLSDLSGSVRVGTCLLGHRSMGQYSFSTSCLDGISTTAIWEATNCSGTPAVTRTGGVDSCFPSYAETNTYTRFLCPAGSDSRMCAALGPFILWIWFPLVAAIVITGLFGGTFLAVTVLLFKYRKKRYVFRGGKLAAGSTLEGPTSPRGVAVSAMDITEEIITLRRIYGARISTVSAYSSQSPRGGAILTAMCITNSLVLMGILANHIAIQTKISPVTTSASGFNDGTLPDWFAFAGYFALMFTGLVPTVPPKPLSALDEYNSNVIVMWMVWDTSHCCGWYVVKFFHNCGVALFLVCSIIAAFLRSPNFTEYVLLALATTFVCCFIVLQSVLEGRMRYALHKEAQSIPNEMLEEPMNDEIHHDKEAEDDHNRMLSSFVFLFEVLAFTTVLTLAFGMETWNIFPCANYGTYMAYATIGIGVFVPVVVFLLVIAKITQKDVPPTPNQSAAAFPPQGTHTRG